MSLSISSSSDEFTLSLEGNKTEPHAPSTIQRVARRALDCLVMVWFNLQWGFYYIGMCAPLSRYYLFPGRVLCVTANYAKWGDLFTYLKLKNDPIQTSEAVLSLARAKGLTPQNSIIPRPFTNGHCYGNVTVFLEMWHKTENIEEIVAAFEGGSPLAGATYQEFYERYFFPQDMYPSLARLILEVINTSDDISFEEEREKWQRAGLDKELTTMLLGALEVYLENEEPPEEGLAQFIVNWVATHHNTSIGGIILATLKQAETAITGDSLILKENTESFFNYINLTCDSSSLFQCSSSAFLECASQLEDGTYSISTPVYNSFGVKRGAHALGLIVADDRCYYLDSNLCIGWSLKADLVETLGRNLTLYTGFDYSHDFAGEHPPWWRKIVNFLTEGPNPPSQPIGKQFDLIKINKTSIL